VRTSRTIDTSERRCKVDPVAVRVTILEGCLELRIRRHASRNRDAGQGLRGDREACDERDLASSEGAHSVRFVGVALEVCSGSVGCDIVMNSW